MSTSTFLFVVFNVFLSVALFILWIRHLRPPKEDPRLSRGLQLLQSKISVLEDLSERTETQVRQLVQILDERVKSLQIKILKAEEVIFKVEQSMAKSLNVAEIFQDKIPHQEIIERNQTQKYVTAAKLANEGKTLEEISAQVDIPRSELEFLVKVNRDELTFNPELLPEWAKPKAERKNELETQMVERVFHTKLPDLSALNKIEADFRHTVNEIKKQEELKVREFEARQKFVDQKVVDQKFVDQKFTEKKLTEQKLTQQKLSGQKPSEQKPLIRKVQFPRITLDKTK